MTFDVWQRKTPMTNFEENKQPLCFSWLWMASPPWSSHRPRSLISTTKSLTECLPFTLAFHPLRSPAHPRHPSTCLPPVFPLFLPCLNPASSSPFFLWDLKNRLPDIYTISQRCLGLGYHSFSNYFPPRETVFPPQNFKYRSFFLWNLTEIVISGSRIFFSTFPGYLSNAFLGGSSCHPSHFTFHIFCFFENLKKWTTKKVVRFFWKFLQPK